jgi:arsenical pump membrane protein
LPLLLLFGTVVVLAELAATAEVFDVVAVRLVIAARGSHVMLFALCVVFASLTTVTLSADTTAALLTPVMLELARKLNVKALPMAMTTAWLANTASLLLPVSSLTSLLAANRTGLHTLAFAERMWLPQVVAIGVTIVWLWVWHWRPSVRGAERLSVITPHRPRDYLLFTVAAGACLLFILGALIGVPLGVAAGVSAGVIVVAFLVRQRTALSVRLVPWRLLMFVTGLFVVLQTLVLQPRDGILAPSAVVGAAGAGLSAASPVGPGPVVLAGVAGRGIDGPKTADLVDGEGDHLAVTVYCGRC